MSIYRAQLRNTSNVLSPRVSSEQLRLQVPPKLFGVDSWIPQTIGQWIPDCWSGYRKSTGPKGVAELQRLARNNRRGNLESLVWDTNHVLSVRRHIRCGTDRPWVVQWVQLSTQNVPEMSVLTVFLLTACVCVLFKELVLNMCVYGIIICVEENEREMKWRLN